MSIIISHIINSEWLLQIYNRLYHRYYFGIHTYEIYFQNIIQKHNIWIHQICTEFVYDFFFWNLNQYISIDPGKLHPFLPCGVVYMKTHSHNNKKRKEWEGKERKDNYWLTEALDEIKYERKIIHRVVVFMRIMMGTVAISKLNEIILVMYYFVCI